MKAVLSGAILAVSSMALAFPGVDLIPQALRKTTNHFADSTIHATDCANFAGKWKGVCQNSSSTQEQELDIKQVACSEITIGNDTTSIGGLTGISSATPLEGKTAALSGGAAADWNTDQTVLNVQFVALFRTVGEGAAVPMSGRGQMKLVGQQLIQDFSLGEFSMNCVLNRL